MNMLNEIFDEPMRRFEEMCEAMSIPPVYTNEQIPGYTRGEDMTPEWIETNVDRMMNYDNRHNSEVIL